MTIRWLHLSDTHFREDELWDRRATLRALIAKVRELKEKGLAPDMVFVTGDIAWSGKPQEYEQATRFFHELNKVLELDPKDRWFLVPGNHDVDRSRITRSQRAIQAGLTDEAIVEETLSDSDTMRLLSTRLEAYYTFASDFLGVARTLQTDRPWRTDVREFDGTSVAILQFNSAWIAEGGDADNANLILGEAQVREALNDTPDTFLRIALMHHPLRNLREFDANRVESLLGAKGGAAILLRGHLHLNRTKVLSTPDGNLFELAAGTLYTDETNWPRGFHLGEVDLGKGEARIHLFQYSDEGSGFFAPDNLTYENAPNGVCKIKLSAIYRLGAKKAKPAKTISEDQRLSFTVRYRNAAAAYHGHARFIGFPNQAARPNARVSDLFVPLRMKLRTGTETESYTTAEIAQRLLCPHDSGTPHIVVLGDPGSGKTTLSRFLVMLTAGAITMPGVQVAEETLPLRVAFRDFVEKRRENPSLSLLDYLDLQAKAELSLTLPKNFLRKAIGSGQALLVLDGLDEVGAPEHRAAMRDLVLAFSKAHGMLPMLVTSRIAGYDDAPLGVWRRSELQVGMTLIPFAIMLMEKFDDDDLSTFVINWYSVQEPADPVGRDRGVADLLSALNADDRVRELARTPILATLIAMIHRVEANLPGERTKLYELCVRMLLETWPAQAKRPFTEIDPGLQRAYLESLAFSMQLARKEEAEAVTIKRGDLVARLLPILRKRDFTMDPEEKVAGLIERWIEHLDKQSGILIEQSTGAYTFFHLSIMEYLAAKGMERDLGRKGAVAAIAQRFAEWREVSLLAVGSHAEDGDFLDAVYEGVSESVVVGSWVFLLRCLREEARFRSDQRDTILSHYAKMLLRDGRMPSDLPLIDQIQRFSVRHGEAVQRWIARRLNHAAGDELVATAALTTEPYLQPILSCLAKRQDRPVAAGALLELWPSSPLGAWAASEVDAKSTLIWIDRAPHELAPLRGVAALRESEPLAAASLVSLNQRTLQSCSEGTVNLDRIAKRLNPRRPPLLLHFTIEPGREILVTSPRTPYEQVGRPNNAFLRFAKHFCLENAGKFARGFASDLTSTFQCDFARSFARHFAGAFACDFTVYFARDLDLDFVNHFGDRPFVDFTPVSVRDFADNFARDIESDFGLLRDFAIDSAEYFGLHYTDAKAVSDRSLISSLQTSISDLEAKPAASRLLARMAGEAWISLATMYGSSRDERLAFFFFRRQNRWLFEVWNGIDNRLPENPSPAQLALYFALGWAQSTTTWAWPDSERWRTLFAAGPGEHWLVRSQWHLCKLTDDPASKDDDAGLRAALRDGLDDESLPGYAARLSEVLGIEG